MARSNYSVNNVCKFMANLLDSHSQALKCFLWYWKGTTKFGIQLSPAAVRHSLSLHDFYDVDWTADLDHYIYVLASSIYFIPNLIFWWSHK